MHLKSIAKKSKIETLQDLFKLYPDLKLSEYHLFGVDGNQSVTLNKNKLSLLNFT